MRSAHGLFREVGLLQHHGPGLAEALRGAPGGLDAHLHGVLRGQADARDRRRLLRRTLEVSVEKQSQRDFFLFVMEVSLRRG